MDKLFKPHRREAVVMALREVRLAFRDTMNEVRARIIQSLEDSNQIPLVREDFNQFARTIEADLKQFDLSTCDNKTVTASVGETNDMSQLLRLAVVAHQKGHEEEAQQMFAYASFNSNDLSMGEMPVPNNMQNKCPACASALPTVANFCPICGVKLDNYMTMNPSPLQPAQEVQPRLIDPGLVHPQQEAKPLPMQSIDPSFSNPLTPTYPYNALNPAIAKLVKKLTLEGKHEEALKLIDASNSVE